MSDARTVSYSVSFGKAPPQPPAVTGRVPRVAKLMALAHRIDDLVRQGIAADYAAVARLGQVTRAHVTQITNLLLLAPDLQEELLFLEPVVAGRDPIVLKQLQPLAAVPDWHRQRAMWNELTSPAAASPAE